MHQGSDRLVIKPLKEQFEDAVRDNRMLDAIKAYRLWKEVGFKEAVQYVKNNWNDLRLLHSY